MHAMTTKQVCAAVSRATGESLETIRHRGFSIKRLPDPDVDSGGGEVRLALDCPFCGALVVLSHDGPAGLPVVAECDRCDTMFGYDCAEVYVVNLATVELPVAGERSFDQAVAA